MLDLGQRICIIGPSGSGKSTLANKLSLKYHLPVTHLDQIAHIPGSAWIMRPKPEVAVLHDSIIQKENWIIEGSYSFCMPQRLEIAQSLIWLDLPVAACLLRFIKRSFLQYPAKRIGRLQNAKSEFSFALLHYILFKTSKNRIKYQSLIEQNLHLNTIRISSIKQLNSFYADHGLAVPQ